MWAMGTAKRPERTAKLEMTTIRLSAEDRSILRKLEKLTGLPTSGIIRLAIRESLRARQEGRA